MTPPDDIRIVFVTGPSGAGRTTAIRALEDIGFEVIDNLPLNLLDRLVDGTPPAGPLALGMDARTRGFDAQRLADEVARLDLIPGILADLLFLECDPTTLQHRYSETRRRHPLAPDDDPAVGIARESALLAPARAAASVLIDTRDMTPHSLRAQIAELFSETGALELNTTVTSFSYRRGVPTGADLVFDCRFLRNPHWQPGLRAHDGRDPVVQAYIAEDPRYAPFVAQVKSMLDLLLPAFKEEGKSHLTVAFGCTGGKHRSVALTEITASHLAEAGWRVSKRHREVEQRRAAGRAANASEA